jgi:transcriptional regulator with XRE-family HTH domain
MSDISFSTISRIINDKNYSPTLTTLERIARALDISISDLYEETEK